MLKLPFGARVYGRQYTTPSEYDLILEVRRRELVLEYLNGNQFPRIAYRYVRK